MRDDEVCSLRINVRFRNDLVLGSDFLPFVKESLTISSYITFVILQIFRVMS